MEKKEPTLTIDQKNLDKAINNANKMAKEIREITSGINDINDYTAQYNEYLKKSVESNIILNKINKDNANILHREIISMDKIKNLDIEIQVSKRKIMNNQQNLSKETANILQLEKAKQNLDAIS